MARRWIRLSPEQTAGVTAFPAGCRVAIPLDDVGSDNGDLAPLPSTPSRRNTDEPDDDDDDDGYDDGDGYDDDDDSVERFRTGTVASVLIDVRERQGGRRQIWHEVLLDAAPPAPPPRPPSTSHADAENVAPGAVSSIAAAVATVEEGRLMYAPNCPASLIDVSRRRPRCECAGAGSGAGAADAGDDNGRKRRKRRCTILAFDRGTHRAETNDSGRNGGGGGDGEDTGVAAGATYTVMVTSNDGTTRSLRRGVPLGRLSYRETACDSDPSAVGAPLPAPEAPPPPVTAAVASGGTESTKVATVLDGCGNSDAGRKGDAAPAKQQTTPKKEEPKKATPVNKRTQAKKKRSPVKNETLAKKRTQTKKHLPPYKHQTLAKKNQTTLTALAMKETPTTVMPAVKAIPIEGTGAKITARELLQAPAAEIGTPDERGARAKTESKAKLPANVRMPARRASKRMAAAMKDTPATKEGKVEKRRRATSPKLSRDALLEINDATPTMETPAEEINRGGGAEKERGDKLKRAKSRKLSRGALLERKEASNKETPEKETSSMTASIARGSSSSSGSGDFLKRRKRAGDELVWVLIGKTRHPAHELVSSDGNDDGDVVWVEWCSTGKIDKVRRGAIDCRLMPRTRRRPGYFEGGAATSKA